MQWRRRDIIKVMVVVTLAWVLLMVALGQWQRRAANARDPKLLHYPGTESVAEQVIPNLGFHKFWFHFDEDYPSVRVYDFYRMELPQQGWRFTWSGTPTWQRTLEKDKAQDLFMAGWVSNDGLFEITLQMLSEVKLDRHDDGTVTEDRAPGMEVYVTMRRVLVPWSFGEKPPQAAPLPGSR